MDDKTKSPQSINTYGNAQSSGQPSSPPENSERTHTTEQSTNTETKDTNVSDHIANTDETSANEQSPKTDENTQDLPPPQPTNTDQNATNVLPSDKPEKPKKHFNIYKVLTILFVLLFFGGLLFATWYFQSQLRNTTTDSNNKSSAPVQVIQKTLVVGTDPTFQPMEYTENNVLVGYDIDLANFLAKELKTDVEFKNIVFDDLFTALERSEIDMIISAITITEERKQKYDFSVEYLNAGQMIITRKTDIEIRSTADLRGKRIAVQKGTTNETESLKYTDKDKVMLYPNFQEATKSLVQGESDAMFTDLPNAKGIIVANPTLKIASDPFTSEYYGIVFRKGDPNKEQIDNALNALRVKGLLTDLKQKWLD